MTSDPSDGTGRDAVDPALIGLLDGFPRLDLSMASLDALRESLAVPPSFFIDTGAAVGVTQARVPGPEGAPDVGVLIYRPHGLDGAIPCILHLHGGGYVFGAAATQSLQHQALAAALSCCIVSVDYRLAPETRFPGAIEDCYAVLTWLVAQREALAIDPARLGVMGESAGGGLAAALALLARDRGGPTLAFQHLIYPMIDDRTGSVGDAHPHAGAFVWTSQNNRFGWGALLGGPPGSPGTSPYAAAARATDLAGLPPAFISCGALDLFVEEDIDYARRLIRAGVPVELHIYPGAFHGFDFDLTAPVALQARRDSQAALARAMADANIGPRPARVAASRYGACPASG